MKINFSPACRADITIELIYRGKLAPSWLTVNVLNKEPECHSLIAELSRQSGISWHRGKSDDEATYRMTPGIDGFTVASILTEALEALEPRPAILKIVCYHDESSIEVDSFRKGSVAKTLNLNADTFL